MPPLMSESRGLFIDCSQEPDYMRYSQCLQGFSSLATGRSAGIRTLDPLIKSQLLYQLSYTSMMPGPQTGPVQKNGASEGIRTLDNHLGKVTLYQLSYARVRKRGGIYHFPELIQLFFIVTRKEASRPWALSAFLSGRGWPG